MKKTLLTWLFLLLLSACSSTDEINSDTPDGLYKLAQNYEKDERFEEALAHYNELRNKHPYSKLATEADLSVADIHFKREAYLEAENSYKLFKEFHPKHAKIDYVTFRLAMSIFKQLPDSIDRDLSLANDAILYFEQVFTNYPDSDYAGSARDHKNKCLLKLARKELYIADFYLIREKYDSALSRFEGILGKFPNLGLEPKVLYKATESAVNSKDKPKAQKYYNQLLSGFPKSKWAEKAKSDFAKKM